MMGSVGSYKVFLPLVIKPLEDLVTNFNVGPTTVDLTVLKVSWFPVSQQKTCLNINITGSPEKLIVESGWFFGDSVWREYNGQSIQVQSYTSPDELAKQIMGFEISNPQNLKVCTVSELGQGTEIGLRMKVVP